MQACSFPVELSVLQRAALPRRHRGLHGALRGTACSCLLASSTRTVCMCCMYAFVCARVCVCSLFVRGCSLGVWSSAYHAPLLALSSIPAHIFEGSFSWVCFRYSILSYDRGFAGSAAHSGVSALHACRNQRARYVLPAH